MTYRVHFTRNGADGRREYTAVDIEAKDGVSVGEAIDAALRGQPEARLVVVEYVEY